MARIVPTGPDTFQYIDDDKDQVEIITDFDQGQSTPEQRARDYRLPPSRQPSGYLQNSANPRGPLLYTSGQSAGMNRSQGTLPASEPRISYELRTFEPEPGPYLNQSMGSLPEREPPVNYGYYDVRTEAAPAGSDYDFQVVSMRRRGDDAFVTYDDRGELVNNRPRQTGLRLDNQGEVSPGQTILTNERGDVVGVRTAPAQEPYRGGMYYSDYEPTTRVEPQVQEYYRPSAVQGGRGTTIRAWRGDRPEQYGEPEVVGPMVIDPNYSIYGQQMSRLEPEVIYIGVGSREPEVQRTTQPIEMWVPPGPSHDPGYTIYDLGRRPDRSRSDKGQRRSWRD